MMRADIIARLILGAFIAFAIIMIGVIQATAQAIEPGAQERAAFFLRMESARLWELDDKGKPVLTDCCGPGDWTLVNVIGSGPGFITVEVTDPRRHEYAKKGMQIVVPMKDRVRGESSPWGVPGLFLSNNSSLKPICFVGVTGG